MNKKMSNAPVYYALAQAQFNPVAVMSKYIDEVQDLLRKDGYTIFEPQQVTQLQLQAVSGKVKTEPQVAHTTSWLFTKSDRSSGFILSQSSITYHTTQYGTRYCFIPELIRGLKAVHQVVKLDHVSRLGLRYLDAVWPKEGETVDQYLVDELHGINFGAKQLHALNESVFETESKLDCPKGILVARVYRMTSSLGYPPDMVPNGLVALPRFDIKESKLHAVIDTDHFSEGIMPLDFELVEKRLLELHSTIKSVFDAAVTEHARQTWA